MINDSASTPEKWNGTTVFNCGKMRVNWRTVYNLNYFAHDSACYTNSEHFFWAQQERENSLKKPWPELPRFHRAVGGVGVGGCPSCIFTTIQHQITLLRKKNHYLMSTDAILRKFRLWEFSFDESFGIVRSIIFYLHSSRFVSEIILIQQ